MTATLGSALISRARIHVERYAIGYADVLVVDDTTIAPGTSAPLTVGTLSLVGGITSSGDFGGQARHHWSAGVVGTTTDANGNSVGVSAWSLTLPSRPYHDDGGIMLSAVLADLERDAATAAGASSLGAVLEVPDVRLDVAGSWTRPAAVGRDLLDALAVAAGQPRGAWWVAADGGTHLGPRPASSANLSDLTVDPFDPALLRAVIRVASDDFAPLLPGASLTAPGLAAPLPIGAIIVTVDGEDISAEVWGESSNAELFARVVDRLTSWRAYLRATPYQVTGINDDLSVAIQPVQPADGRTVDMPDAPAIGHVPGVPGVSFELDIGSGVVVENLAGDPGSPVVTGYPPGVLPIKVIHEVSEAVFLGGGTGTQPVVLTQDASWFSQVVTALGQVKAAGGSGNLPALLAALAALAVPTAPTPTAATKVRAV